MERLKYVPALWIYSSMDRRDTVFLDSSMGGGRSYIGLMPHRVFLPGESDAVEVLDGMSDDDVLMGYLSYDYGLFLHGISSIHPKTQIPDFILADFDVVIEEDPVGKRLHVTCRGRVMPVCDEERFVMRLVEGASPPEDIPGHGYDVVSDMSRSDFVRSVEEARSMMAEGEFYVINLSRSISVRSSSDPFGTFLRLRRLSPSPFGAYADLCGIQIASSSMEMLLDHRDGVVRTRPIKGTSPRTGDSKKDRDSLSALLSSDKDRSELLMVTDMERNDMNRFCVPGSVDVGSFFRPEVYSTLYHTVSDVVGRVREGVRTGEMVSCMFPGGSVTGAPKEVCMEAIDSLEACRRGIYTGVDGDLLRAYDRDEHNHTYHGAFGGHVHHRRRQRDNIRIRSRRRVRRDVAEGVGHAEVSGGVMMEHDDGFSFGIGAFETMLVHDGRCIMFVRHMDRLRRALESLGVGNRVDPRMLEDEVSDGHLDGRVLKVEVSERNVVISDRPVPYSDGDYARGFRLRIPEVRRNESSPFTYMKSLQYGDSIMEKRKAKADGFDEPLFLNCRGEICEGATTNIFFSKGGRLYTPEKRCGLLPGTVRSYVMEKFGAEEGVFFPEDLHGFDGCFVTNSVLGIMPVASIGGVGFHDRSLCDGIRKTYLRDVEDGL